MEELRQKQKIICYHKNIVLILSKILSNPVYPVGEKKERK